MSILNISYYSRVSKWSLYQEGKEMEMKNMFVERNVEKEVISEIYKMIRSFKSIGQRYFAKA